jgi:type I restriction enzyme, S subunit
MSPDALALAESNILPRGWSWVPLGQLGSWVGGGTPSKSVAAYWANGSIAWVSPKDMKEEIIHRTVDHITEAAVASSATKFVPAGSVLMVMRSGILRHTFPVAVNADRVTVNQDLRALIPAEGINPKYVAHYLRGIQRQVLDKCSKDGTTVQSIEVSALERVRIPIAPAAEQRRIVARIDELFAEIAEGEAALQRSRLGLDTWRRALLKAAVTGELTRDWREANRPAETGADLLARIRTEREAAVSSDRRSQFPRLLNPSAVLLPELPGGWVYAPLGDFIAKIEAGLNVKAFGRPPQIDEIGIVKVSAVTWGEFDELASKTLPSDAVFDGADTIKPGDFLFSRANTLELVGAPVIVKHCTRRLVLSDKVLRIRLVGRVDRWIEIFLKSPYGRLQIESFSTGNQLSEKGFRQSILKAAFEGRLVPHDPADEPASALLARLRNNYPGNGARRRKRRATRDFFHPPLPGLAPSVDPRVEPADDG